MNRTAFFILAGCALSGSSFVIAQQQPESRGSNRQAPENSVAGYVDRMLTFDSNSDGSISTAELTDARLQALFQRADADSDGVVTRAELTGLFERESAALGSNGPGGPNGPGSRGPNGPGSGSVRPDGPGGSGPRGAGAGDFGRGRGPGAPPTPGQILPGRLRDELGLSEEQVQQLDALQADVDARLKQILTAAQRERLQSFSRPPGPPRPDQRRPENQ